MATILTVHGTNDSGPPTGDHWWQAGSYFEQHLRELVEADGGGPIKVEPLIWDGRNSETSRFRAGARLRARMAELDKLGEPYCLIGHSHGGSVVGHALMLAARRMKTMPRGLAQCVTVGTPFIQTKRSWFLFSRLGLFGRSAYVVWSLICLSFELFVIAILMSKSFATYTIAIKIIGAAIFATVTFCVWFALIFGLSFVQPRKLQRLRKQRLSAARDVYAGRWLPLYHAHDEAVQGLSAVRQLSIRPFDRAFGMQVFVMGVFGVMLAAAAIAGSQEPVAEHLRQTLSYLASTQQLDDAVGKPNTLYRSILYFVLLPSYALGWLTRTLGLDTSSIPGGMLFLLFGLIGTSLISFAAVAGALWIAGWVARPICFAISHVLNRSTQSEIRRMVWGMDGVGETAIGASPDPVFSVAPSRPLPNALAQEITEKSDAATVLSVGRLRAALREFALLGANAKNADALLAYLNWNELIHTTYFHVPRFRKLIAYAISISPGFQPTEAFRTDPDYRLVAGWYGELRPPAEPAETPTVQV